MLVLLTTIEVANFNDPSEVRAWLTSHPLANIISIAIQDHYFYIFYS